RSFSVRSFPEPNARDFARRDYLGQSQSIRSVLYPRVSCQLRLSLVSPELLKYLVVSPPIWEGGH
ncbi:hypothetical protein COCCADRAFT_110779, partial [Bipolaris zeicola 26-R-13]